MATINTDMTVVIAFLESLFQSGVHNVCISPGSRSTPITIAAARHGKIRVWTLLDERSAGFFALGMARILHEPVALVCTSGTATGNYLPAVMEAYKTHVPLLIITADRPPELLGVGSNQTVEQTNLYGHHVKHFITMPVPDGDPTLINHATATAARITSIALTLSQGPVHVNWPLREPLLPPTDIDLSIHAPVMYRQVRTIANDQADFFSQLFSTTVKGLIVCGPLDDHEDAASIRALATKLGYPLLADPLSQQRSLGTESSLVIDMYDLLLRGAFSTNQEERERLLSPLKPDLIIRFSHTPTSKALGQYMSSLSSVRHIIIDPSDQSWEDPYFLATDVVQADNQSFCDSIGARLVVRETTDWAKRWQNVNATLVKAQEQARQQTDGLFEGSIVEVLANTLVDDSILFIGNSMPIRDIDSFFVQTPRKIMLLANRGVSGIDGVVSTAVGVAAASPLQSVVLLIGDLSFYHDLNGLLATKLHNVSLTIVLINNDGGGIFSMLPSASQKDVTPYFATPHGLDFAFVSQMYGATWHDIVDLSAFREALQEAMGMSGLHMLQLRSDRELNARLHEQIYQSCFAAIRS